MGYSIEHNNSVLWRDCNAFTLIELITATALVGLLIVGISALSQLVINETHSAETEQRDIYAVFISYLSWRVDDIAVVVQYDSTEVHFLDQRGQSQTLNLIQAWNIFMFQPEIQPIPSMYFSLSARRNIAIKDQLPIRLSERKDYQLIINISGVTNKNENIASQIHQSVQMRLR